MIKVEQFTESEKFRARIHDLIPGGAHTYSKGDDQFPRRSPAAISRGKGAYVWDVDGNKYLDCTMGLTAISLGHAYEPVLAYVRKELENGSNFQRPSYIELEIAEEFLSLVPIHQMVKFAKNGSTVTTAALKLARAFTGRKLVAFPGDHPFYSYDDWFIGKTACPRGIPEEVQALSLTYRGDDLASLKELFDKYPKQIACVISEPERNFGVPDGYVQSAIDLTHKHGALYVVDEMITGFKTAFPGSITKFGVVPDMATWGKGIANGFSLCALTGKKEIMELGGIRRAGQEKVFLISTTHGAETHSMAAGRGTIHEFINNDVVTKLHRLGKYFINTVSDAIERNGLSEYLEVVPCAWMPLVIFRDAAKVVSLSMRTLMMQELISRGILFQGSFVPCFSHTQSDIDYFVEAFEESLDIYRNALNDGIDGFLFGEPVKPVFRRYL